MKLNGALSKTLDTARNLLNTIKNSHKTILYALNSLELMDFKYKMMVKIYLPRFLIFIFINVMVLLLVLIVRLVLILNCFLKIFKFKLLLIQKIWILQNMEIDQLILSKTKYSIYTLEQWMVKLYK
jgi:hypothetical protein